MPTNHPTEPPDEQELRDLSRRILKAHDEQLAREADLPPARELAAESRRAADVCRQARRQALDEFRARVRSGENLAAALRTLHEARGAEWKAESVERAHRTAYKAAKQALREARAQVAGLMDSLDDYPLFAFAKRNGRRRGAAAREPSAN